MKMCSRCGVEKNITEFRKRSAVSHGTTAWCKKCFSDYDRERYRLSKEERERKKRNQNRIILNSQKIIWEYLSKNPCIDCGESDPVVLEFDHIDPKEKYMNVSELMKYGSSKVTEEIKKCQVRCANCHRRKTARQFNTWRFNKK